MKKLILALILGLMAVTTIHAQQTVVIERPGVLTDLASAAGAIVALSLAAVEGIIVGIVEASDTLIHGSTQIVVAPPARAVPAPIIVTSAPVMVAPPVVVNLFPVQTCDISEVESFFGAIVDDMVSLDRWIVWRI